MQESKIELIWANKSKHKNKKGFLEDDHDCFQMSYTQTGTGILHIDGLPYDIKSGILYIIPPYSKHSLTITSKEPQEGVELKFKLSAGSLYDKIVALPHVIECTKEIEVLLLGAHLEIVKNSSNAIECASHYAMIVLFNLIRICESDDEPSTLFHEVPFGDELLMNIKNYIVSNISQKFHLDNLSHVFGYNKAYLCKMFKQRYGITIMDYYNSIRMRIAQQLIVEKEQGFTYISEYLGFENTNHFSRIFKKYVGMPPGEYKEKQLNFVNNGISVRYDYINPDYFNLK